MPCAIAGFVGPATCNPVTREFVVPYENCEIDGALPGTVMKLNGQLQRFVLDRPNICETVPELAPYDVRLTDFTREICVKTGGHCGDRLERISFAGRVPGQAYSFRRQSNPSSGGGATCDGEVTGVDTLDGTLRFECEPSAFPNCAPEGEDTTLNLSGLSLTSMTDGGGGTCTRDTRFNGHMVVDNVVTSKPGPPHEHYTQDFSNLLVRRLRRQGGGGGGSLLPSTSDELFIEGLITVDVIGSIDIRTTRAIRFGTDRRCADDGALQVAFVTAGMPAGGGAVANESSAAAQAAGPFEAAQAVTAEEVATDTGLRQRVYRSANGHLYQVLQNVGSSPDLNAEDFRVTSVVGVEGEANFVRCDNTKVQDGGRKPLENSGVGGSAVPLERFDPTSGQTSSAVKRSGRVGDTKTCFNPNANDSDGSVCVGACDDDCTCPVGNGCNEIAWPTASMIPIGAFADQIVPAAQIVQYDSTSRCLDLTGESTYRFGASGPTTSVTRCASTNPGPGNEAVGSDGFSLPPQTSLVFAYDVPFGREFACGAAGFAVDTNGMNGRCNNTSNVLLIRGNEADTVLAPNITFGQHQGVELDADGDRATDKALPRCDARLIEARPAFPTQPPICSTRDLGGAIVASDSVSTVGRTNAAVGARCGDGGNRAPDVAFAFTPPVSGLYVIDTIGSDFDTIVSVHRGSCTGPALGCNDDEPTGTSLQSELLSLMLEANQPVTIIVDGFGGSSGQVQLHVELAGFMTPTPTPTVGLPDLAVAQLSVRRIRIVIRSVERPAETLAASTRITNVGNQTSASFSVVFELRDPASGSFRNLGSCDLVGLAPAANATCDQVFAEDLLPAGSIEIRSRVIPNGADQSTGNDVQSVVVAIGGPTPVPGCPTNQLTSASNLSVSGSTAAQASSLGGASCGGGGGNAPDVSYAFTAPQAGFYEIDTSGSQYDTVLYVRSSCNGMELPSADGIGTACNDDYFSFTSRVLVQLTAGQQIIIVVDGFSDSRGPFTLNIHRSDLVPSTPVPTPTPPFSDARLIVGPNGPVVVAPGGQGAFDVYLLTGGVVSAAGMDIGFDPLNAPIVALADGRPDCTVNPAIQKDESIFVFRPSGCSGSACNQVRAGIISFFNANPIPDGSVLFTCRVRASANAAPGTYPLPISSISLSTPEGNDFFNASGQGGSVAVSSPSGSACPASNLTSSTSVSASGSTIGRLSSQGGAPCGGGGGLAPDFSYLYTPPETGLYEIDTIGSNFDTLLYVSSSCAASATPLACNDDAVGAASRVLVQLTAGVPVVIVVDGFSTASGSFVLNLRRSSGVATPTPTPASFGILGLSSSLSQRAVDGTVYQVIALGETPFVGGADAVRITTIAGSVNGVQSCSTTGFFSGSSAAAIAGPDPAAGQALYPYDLVRRTSVLSPNSFNLAFDPSGSGRLTIGSGAGAVDVCRNPAQNCSGGALDAPVVGLAASDANVPAACIAPGAQSSCRVPFAQAATFGFGVAADALHNCVGQPTTDTVVCTPPPADGLTLRSGQVLVLIYPDLQFSSFTFGLGGFGFDTDGVNSTGCPVNSVVAGLAESVSAPPPPPPPTPTATPAPLRCGNGTLDSGEDCDDGGICVGGSNAGNSCVSEAQCFGNGACLSGVKAGYGCSSNADCPGSRCAHCRPVGGDGCAANCTTETTVAYDFVPGQLEGLNLIPGTSGVVANSDILTIPISTTGSQALTVGRAGSDGTIPFVIKANTVQIPPSNVSSIACACLRGVAQATCGGTVFEPDGSFSPSCTAGFLNSTSCTTDKPCAPVHGSGNNAAGVIDCGSSGLPGINLSLTQDSGAEGGLPGPLIVSTSDTGTRGAAQGLATTAFGIVVGGCQPGACSAADPVDVRGIPLTLPFTTGIASAQVTGANDQLGLTIGPFSGQGAPIDCDRLTGIPPEVVGLGLVSAVPQLGMGLLGDNVVVQQLYAAAGPLPTPTFGLPPTPTPPPALPDLFVEVITAPASGVIGGSINISLTVRNQGAGAATGSFGGGFYFSTDNAITQMDIPSGFGCGWNGVGAGGTVGCGGLIGVPASLTPGLYYVGFLVDGTIAETNSANNGRAADNQTSFSPPPLTPTPTRSGTPTRTPTVTPSRTRTATPTGSPTAISIAIVEVIPPAVNAGLTDIVSDNNGRMWFTEQLANRIGRLIIDTGHITEFPLPVLNGQARGAGAITFGPDEKLWFVETAANQIGRIDQNGNITEFMIPFASNGLTDIIKASDGALWFTERNTDRLGSISQSGQPTEIAVLPAGSQPMGMGIGLDADVLWFTERGTNKIARVRTKIPMKGIVEHFDVVTPNAGVTAIEFANGYMWFTEANVNKIGRINVNTMAVEEFGPTSSAPNQMVRGIDGFIWFTLSDGNRIGRISLDGHTISELGIPTANSRPLGITATFSDRRIWFTEINGNKVAYLTAP
jgi:virginiamycin B lyase